MNIKRWRPTLLLTVVMGFMTATSTAGPFPEQLGIKTRSVVLIAGEKTHGPGAHEYIKTVRLLKAMLDHCNVPGLTTTIVLHGWPADVSILDHADLILFFTDGGDGDSTQYDPFMRPGRIEIMKKEMDRGCGFSVIHYSTFAPDSYGKMMLEWGGGYFDWQDDDGTHHYYSAIKTTTGTVTFPDPANPITNGVHPFTFKEEYYYNIRFAENDKRLLPVAIVPELDGRENRGKVVAWAVERKDHGRGFSTTMGHSYSNWNNADFRKLLLNGIVWAAGAEVPAAGVEARVYSDKEVTGILYGKPRKELLIVNPDSSMAPKNEMINLMNRNEVFHTDVATGIKDIEQYDLGDYDLLVLANYQLGDSTSVSNEQRKILDRYIKEGGGLLMGGETFLKEYFKKERRSKKP